MIAKIILGGLSVIIFGLIIIFFTFVKKDDAPDILDTIPDVSISDAGLDQGRVNSQDESGTGDGLLHKEDVQQAPVEVLSVQDPVIFAPDFSLQSLDENSTYVLSSFAGNKPVIVDFFAAHCPNCRRNLPKLEALQAKFGDQVEVVLVGIDSRSDTQRYFENNPTNIPVVMSNSRVLSDYAIRLTNTKALINRDGSLAEIVEFRDILEDDFIRLIES